MIDTATKSSTSNVLDLSSLSWFALDDGVMGGQSSTERGEVDEEGTLQFSGTINTNGGGFCSIRAELPASLPPNSTGIRIKFKGDGKTFKFTMSDGSHRYDTLSWQQDIPTTAKSGDLEVLEVHYSDLIPAMGPRKAPSGISFNKDLVKEITFMLSLQLSNGKPNPVSTFGKGVFPFDLEIHSVEFIES
ncbi:unnamed protein product [Cylindrotheca closterium]|uniref:NADH:ubiquinone oxidoreductase intermediate-associated protein 30 domain-containing protein n=1 Tax=Cylindrotheca closterium TaxID=2856 RepID=A0AAD2FNB0_9STRA|nr:unnamed protein product [Cylindrotheca closterium]